jgi:hypothetical protein
MSTDMMLESSEALKAHELFRDAVVRAESIDQMARFLKMYVEFNYPFAGGVLNLASAIHLNDAWFQPGAEDAKTAGASASIIASYVLAAAEDEYATPSGGRISHRYIADRLLSDFSSDGATTLLCQRDSAAIIGMRRLAETGYGVGATWDRCALGRSLGFHLASEYSGGIEFKILDERLRPLAAASNLAEASFTWVSLHVSVEPEHFAMARRSIDLTLEHAPGVDLTAIQAGITAFYELLASFSDAAR